MWRHAKASFNQYSRKNNFYARYLAKHMFWKSCRNSNLNQLNEFFRLASLLYNPTETPEIVVSEEVPTESSESEEEVESEPEFGYF